MIGKVLFFIILLINILPVYGEDDSIAEVAVAGETTSIDKHGKFYGEVVTQWLPDGRKMKLLETVVFVDPQGVVWDAPKGSIVDGASIPKQVWSVAGGPYSGKYRLASLIHDVACERKNRDWRSVHRAFFDAMLASGVSMEEAKIKYFAVHNYGPRWGEKTSNERLSEEDFQKVLKKKPEERAVYIENLLMFKRSGLEVAQGSINDFVIDIKTRGYYHTMKKLIQGGVIDIRSYFTENYSIVTPSYRFMTIENAMLFLFSIFILGAFVNILSKIWTHAFILFLIVCLINLLY